ncbi:MAG: mannose-1-phosphate guanylyltransferase [Acidobacteria bacterium]|nr:mannose-1-phosphate guanylyltransferase [Acidobacteriota bacterium]MBI3422376.1 mannose-1-phosphate guanylyltransferase [Acidobacteriota bacterium]
MFVIIMAGGSGTRFWPASRAHYPKQFLNITSDRSMLAETIARAERFTPLDHIGVVVGSVHAELTNQQIGAQPVKVLIEPFGRNTAACIGLAALHVKQWGGLDEPIIILPADHFIADVATFTATLQAAAETARNGSVVTLGIQPTRPETGYGYIHTGAAQGATNGLPYFQVERFVEKPNYETAVGYLAGGDYFWNSGIFIFTARTILQEIEICLPKLYAGLLEIELAIGSPAYDTVVERVYGRLESISIDYGVMERTQKPIYVFKADFGWSDVGSWQALYELRASEYDAQGNLLLGDTLVSDAHNNLVFSSTDRKVALLGVAGLVVVDTPDAVMIAPLDRSQDVKVFPEMLKAK